MIGVTLSAHVKADVIDDTNYLSVVGDPMIGGEKKSRGRIPRDYAKHPYGSMGKAFEESGITLIPRHEWAARLDAQERAEESNVHLARLLGIKPKDQNGTNYCWGNGPTTAAQMCRVRRGHKFVSLSPASACAIIKQGANQGGWGTEAVQQMAKRGLNTSKTWSDNARDYRHLDTEAARAEAACFKVIEFIELRPRNLDQLATLLILGFPVAVGFNWWSHEVCALRLRYFGGDVDNDKNWGTDIFNSWGEGYGDNGIGTLKGSKCLPDDAVCIYQMTPYDGD